MCHIERQIHNYCNQDERFGCYHCEQELSEDENTYEVLTRMDGMQIVGECCINEYREER